MENQPAVFVIFGATGDLAKKRIFPALFTLFKNKLLPENFKILACARTPHTSQDFRKVVAEMIKAGEDSTWGDFSKEIDYVSLDLAQGLNLDYLPKAISEFERKVDKCPQKIYYMAIAPDILEDSVENLGKHNLHIGCQSHTSPPRIIVEKPFGSDLESAKKIDRILRKFFINEQIYRIDHYLGKETVQNIFAFRFANEIFEPIWNRDYIDHVQITTAEHIGVEKRGEFYEKTGALRDIIQNHLIQLMTLTAMDEPRNFTPDEINQKKLDVIKNIKKYKNDDIVKNTIRGQYEGYLQEEKIAPDSQTETFAMVKLEIESKRWKGVPFYLRTGKKMPGKVTSIIIQLKDRKHELYNNFWDQQLPNHITIQIQPNEGIGIRLAAKKPGLTPSLEPVDMEFCYKTSFDTPQPEAYERLLLDVIAGDQSLFMDQRVIEESWNIIDPIEKVWTQGKPKLVKYKPGTWGPKEAEDLIQKDKRQWLAPLLTVCKI